jgi:hypothetical protein
VKKILPLILVLSLAANAALAYLMIRGAAVASVGEAPKAIVAPAGSSAPAAPATPKIDTEAWAATKPEQLPGLVADLRAAGFPKDMIRAIVGAIIGEQFAARRKALDPDGEKRAFWKDRSVDPQYQAAQTQLWRDQQKALRDALGADAETDDPLTLARQRQRFGNLSPEKMSDAQAVIRDFDDKRQSVYASGVYTQTEREKIAELDKQQRAALAQVLSPTELEDYDLRSSNTARTLRTELVAFNPTEEEFRLIYKMRQPFDEQFNPMMDSGLPSQEEMTRRSKAQKALNDEIKAALGAIRGPEFEVATDYNYRRTSQVIARLELPPETTKQVWDTQKEFQQRAMDIRRAAQNQADRTAQLTALQQEAVAKLGTMLGGNRGVEAYRQYGGTWLQNLVPQPRPPPKN